MASEGGIGMQKRNHRDEGFTLLEIMASMLILSVVGLTLSGFFVQAMSYAKHNENKTIAIHLARNALSYIQKEPYQPLHVYLTSADAQGHYAAITSESCKLSNEGAAQCSVYRGLAGDLQTLAYVLNPTVNGVPYTVSIQYEPDLKPGLQLKLDEAESDSPNSQSDISPYLMAVKVTVSSKVKDRSEIVEVEGYLTDETIR